MKMHGSAVWRLLDKSAKKIRTQNPHTKLNNQRHNPCQKSAPKSKIRTPKSAPKSAPKSHTKIRAQALNPDTTRTTVSKPPFTDPLLTLGLRGFPNQPDDIDKLQQRKNQITIAIFCRLSRHSPSEEHNPPRGSSRKFASERVLRASLRASLRGVLWGSPEFPKDFQKALPIVTLCL